MYELDDGYQKKFIPKYRVTHNRRCFLYVQCLIRAARNSGIVTGLPDAYGSGRLLVITEECLYMV